MMERTTVRKEILLLCNTDRCDTDVKIIMMVDVNTYDDGYETLIIISNGCG